MKTSKASVFKAKYLHLMNLVNQTNEEIVLTQKGKPVSYLVPYRKQVDSLFGLHKDTINCLDDLIASTGDDWNIDKTYCDKILKLATSD